MFTVGGTGDGDGQRPITGRCVFGFRTVSKKTEWQRDDDSTAMIRTPIVRKRTTTTMMRMAMMMTLLVMKITRNGCRPKNHATITSTLSPIYSRCHDDDNDDVAIVWNAFVE